jgi:hypothetical protein
MEEDGGLAREVECRRKEMGEFQYVCRKSLQNAIEWSTSREKTWKENVLYALLFEKHEFLSFEQQRSSVFFSIIFFHLVYN